MLDEHEKGYFTEETSVEVVTGAQRRTPRTRGCGGAWR